MRRRGRAKKKQGRDQQYLRTAIDRIAGILPAAAGSPVQGFQRDFRRADAAAAMS